jgi:gas vesicle protein
MKIQDLIEGCKHGEYYCSTDKKWKCRQGPKQSRKVAEAFGQSNATDFAVHPQSAREKIGGQVATLGTIAGAIAGFTLTPDGFWGTTGGILGGMFVGAVPGAVIAGSKDAKIRQEKMKRVAANFVSTQPRLKHDFEIFLNSLYNDSPLNKLRALPDLKNIEVVYDQQKEDLDREIRQWLDHYEKEWESLNNAYKIPNTWLLRYAFELIYGKSVMEQWLDKISKMGEKGEYRTPFTSIDTVNKNNPQSSDTNGRIEPTLEQGVAEGLPQTLRKVVPGYAKREIDKKMDAGKFGKTDVDKDANFHRYKKIQDKIKDQGVAEEKQRLDAKCWDGYKKDGTKMKGDTRVNNCVKEELEETYDGDEFFEAYGELWFNEDEQLDEAEYQGRSVPLGKPMQGDVKKFKVYVKDPSTGNVKKVNFGDPDMKIRKSNPAARRSFRARHNCDNPGPRTKARYWSCRKW